MTEPDQDHKPEPSVAEGAAEPGHKDGEHRAGEREGVDTSTVRAGDPEGLESIDDETTDNDGASG